MVNPNLLVAISSPPKTGKTYLACTFPEPILLFSFDLRYKYVLAKFPNKKIEVRDYAPMVIDNADVQSRALALWEPFEDEYKKEIRTGKWKTIVLDPATSVWEICHESYREEEGDKRLISKKYEVPNSRMLPLLIEPRVLGLNLVLIHYLKEIYVADKPTGEFRLDGWKRTESLVDLCLQTRIDTRQVEGKKKNVVVTTIVENAFDLDLNGLELENTTYDELLALIVGK